MNKNTGIIIGVIALVAIVGGVYASSKNNQEVVMVKEPVGQNVVEQEVVEQNTMVKTDTTTKAGSYEAYAPEKIAMASADQDVVLFFRAAWCPTCRAVDADIKANLGTIPSNLTILDVNYDDSTALKQKYGVTYQHTFVQVDKEGNLIKKWSGSRNLAAILEEVK